MSLPLERRYRRLITAYPAGHRATYADEMVNVLMDDARPGQQRPDLTVRLDLLKGAATAWVRATARSWQQARGSAAVALLALLALCTLSFAAAGWVLDQDSTSSYGRGGEAAMWLPHLIWLPVAVAAALGLRRTAAWTALTLGVLLPTIGTAAMPVAGTPDYLGSLNSPAWVLLSLIATAGLLTDGGLRTGAGQLGRRTTLLAATGALLVGVVTMLRPEADAWSGRVGLPLLGLGLALIVVACVRAAVRDPRTRLRVTVAALLVHLALAHGFARMDGGAWIDDLTEQLDITLPLTVLICALAVTLRTAFDPGARTAPRTMTPAG